MSLAGLKRHSAALATPDAIHGPLTDFSPRSGRPLQVIPEALPRDTDGPGAKNSAAKQVPSGFSVPEFEIP